MSSPGPTPTGSPSPLTKTVRNTIFTIIVVILTGLGVVWNKNSIDRQKPVAIGQTVLADVSATGSAQDDFPLHVELSRSVVRLGQYQVVSISTQPFAELNIVTSGSNNRYERPETFRTTADETGKYVFRFRLDDFHDLGQFELVVQAKLADQRASAKQVFELKSWAEKEKVSEEKFLYPLVP